ncbi:hypothetical protein BAX93_05455 [Elizabethkingia meningoseptica]|uniref:hypothetical protein n=1 Tax=Elizabethkingia meningoseptica TaxID=238 RepID=UPI0009C78D6A|nr:hypothetical protein [Elizabethkingia meningoseptica]OPC11948.1 hypothetical protein BAX93_05455 [Elizabethkingia meningoseptica]
MDSLSNRLKSSFKEKKSMVQIFEELNKEIKMDKLELKDIAPYFQYDLIFKNKTTQNNYRLRTIDIRSDGFISLKFSDSNLAITDFMEDEDGSIMKFIPLLRPMSDLTKEITHNGEKFVPMEKLAQIAFERIDAFHIHSDIEIITAYKADKKEAYITLKYDVDNKSFVVSVLDENLFRTRNLATKNQYDLFQKLCEWHIDFQDLIGRGLAINLNEVDNGK